MSGVAPIQADCGFHPAPEVTPLQTEPLFVGGMHPTTDQILGKAAHNNLSQWFEGADIYYAHSARTAIQKALSLLGLGRGDDVLVPAYHCGSELDVLLKAEVNARFFRVDAASEIDFNDLRARITDRTRAVYVIHYFGFPQKMEPIVELCQSRKLHLIEDCALSLLTEINGRRIGSSGDMAIYNFPKMLPVPDGGALVINRAQLQHSGWLRRGPAFSGIARNSLSLLRQNVLRGLPDASVRRLFASFRKPDESAIPAAAPRLEIPEDYYFDRSMTDRNISKVSQWLVGKMEVPQIRARRRRNYSRLLSRISRSQDLKPLFQELAEGVCPLSLPVLVKDARKFAQKLRAETIPAIAWWSGYHRAFPANGEYEEARFLKNSVVALPVHQQLDDRCIDFVADKVIQSLA